MVMSMVMSIMMVLVALLVPMVMFLHLKCFSGAIFSNSPQLWKITK